MCKLFCDFQKLLYADHYQKPLWQCVQGLTVNFLNGTKSFLVWGLKNGKNTMLIILNIAETL